MGARRGLIVGGTSGIGRAFFELAREKDGWVPSEEMGGPEGQDGSGIDWDIPDHIQLDAGNYHEWLEWFEVRDPYDYLVYSAGVNYLQWLGQMDPRRVSDLTDINQLGFIYMLDAYRKARSFNDDANAPRVLVVGSDAADRPMRTSIAYCASKAGLHMAVRVAARELASEGWRINAVAPGMTDSTGMQRYVDDRVQEVRAWSYEQMRDYERTQEVVPGRMVPAEVAEVMWSTLTGPDHLNGSIIYINGGR